MTPTVGLTVFIVLVLLITGAKLYLGYRQIHYVSTHRDDVPLAFAPFISPQAHNKAADYTIVKTTAGMVQTVINALILLWLTAGNGINWITEIWMPFTGDSVILQTLTLFGTVYVIMGIFDLIFDYYRVFYIEAKFGFNRSTLPLWIADQIRGIFVSVVLGAPILLLAVGFMTWFSNTWWFWLWIALILFNAIVMLIYPTWIAPLFNKFEPLKDAQLADKVHALLSKNGVQKASLFVMDGSKRSAHGNAYFTGFGPAKRIVFFDTLLNGLSTDEILAVLAHELGHLKKKHIVKQMLLLAVLTFIVLYLLSWFAGAPLFYESLNVNVISVPVTLLLFMEIVPFILFPLTPVFSAISRHNEFEADEFAAQQTSARSLIDALITLFKENSATLTPDPLYSAVYDSHPSAMARIKKLEEIQS